VLGYYLFGDIADSWTFVGAAIIIASGLYLIYRENKTKGEVTAPAYGVTDTGSSSQ
jgi:drug/metabolite transporter (DMT)-like permease